MNKNLNNICVMCGNESFFIVKANYKTGIENEFLCTECMKTNKKIEEEKWRY